MTSTHLGAFEAQRSGFRQRKGAAPAFRALRDTFHRFARSHADRVRLRRAIGELAQLDERTLRDIGLTPADIEPAAIRATMDRFRGC